MKIIIAGAGEVGTHLAKLLSKEGQDVILIDSDENKLHVVDSNYNLMTQTGSPTAFKTLKTANVKDTDLYIAVTPFETRNIVSCSMAKGLGARKTVARIDNYEFLKPDYIPFFKGIGVDELIYPEYFASAEMVSAIRNTWARNWFELYDGELILIGVKLRSNAQIINIQLKELALKSHNFHISAIRRKHETIIPRGDDHLEIGDIAYFTTKKEFVSQIIELCGKTVTNVKRVMILGGSRIGVQLAHMLGDSYKIKIIELDSKKSFKLAERVPENTTIINGDGRDIELLQEEGIADYDAFIALTDSSETNILACLTAKEFGVSKTIAEVENIQFIPEAENLNIGTIINKKLLATSKIFQILLDFDSSNAKCLALTDAEVAELVVKPGSKVTKAPVKDLKLAKGMTIAGLIRDGKGMLVSGNTQIEAGDHVLIFCLSGAIHKVEKFFN
ncbi:MAG: Trk system potassium transporter TrkA [Bacteroidales bacterium]|nr:Trk system potassium transporter TrkA [Bacteroidales bacterium]MDD6139987.1 Trk system potassium transporter TrkA [Bacteroidales bacterium]MDD6623060.1 Trk system potassium transporter TrkA [Bacteroidales bacterium]MDD6668911.1 Trk system potassium transporter TrkA [Bacteroidales bacterium]